MAQYNTQETRWWVSHTQTGLDYSRPVQLAANFAGAVNGVVKSGTPYPANGATVKGFVINDTALDATNGASAAVLVKGIVDPKYLPVTLNAAAVQALVSKPHIALLDTDGSFVEATAPSSNE
ncbi:MAG: hypothetical protein LBT91_02685 [Bifidobacteriaceae bacterium]|jgi:hypothetical protein|nr:hypothetical protein [Bifidobacteriaceae bacterium]